MGIERSGLSREPRAIPALSGRARNALQQHQRRVAVLQRELHDVDRVLAGALTACDGATQLEMLGAYLEAVQELRVSLQRLEGFLIQRLVSQGAEPEPATLELQPPGYATRAEALPGD
jgi:hypothetical protein